MDLTYRADLRELNELNFARFDAKLEQRLAELRAELRQETAELRAEVRQEFAGLRGELDQKIAGLRGELSKETGELRTRIEGVRAGLLRWMFGFWVTTLIALAGVLISLRGGP